MTTPKRTTYRVWLVAAVVAVAIAPFTLRAGQEPQTITASTVNSEDVWAKTLRLVEDGRFDLKPQRIRDIERLGPTGSQLADWIRERQELEAKRLEMTREDREKYEAWAREQHGKDRIDRALAYTVAAYDNTTEENRDPFRQQAWLQKLRQDALTKGQEHREKGEWLDAHGVYYELAEIYPHDTELRRYKRECLTHARLEVAYKPDGKWKDYLMGIEHRMATKALDKIEQYYVTDVDFAELTVAGLEQLLLLAESEPLREVFPSLNDDFDRQDYIDRVKEKIAQARGDSNFSCRDAQGVCRRALEINLQTVQLPEQVVISEFMDGALETLDEFSSVIWPVEYREFKKHTEGDFIGVGISISRPDNKGITVVTPLEDSPAYRAGILADDLIVAVDGRSTEEMSLTKAVESITGPIGTDVTLTVRRKVGGVEQERDYALTRERIVLQSVKGARRLEADRQSWDYLLDEELGIGYIRVGQFQENTVHYLRRTIADLRDNHGLKGLILDLRFNPGGLLRSAVDMAELFLLKDDKIVSTKGERTPEWAIYARRTGPFADLPLVVLINQTSASASEIVAGALKDHHRAVIIGERTFGKFSVQNLMQLDGTEAHLKLTTAAYYLPSGRSLHRTEDATDWGVNPDIQVALVPKELYKVVTMRRDADVLAPAAEDNGPESPAEDPETETPQADKDTEPADAPSKTDAAEPSKADDDSAENGEEDAEEEEPLPPDPNERPDIDPQLETALLVMRAQRLATLAPQVALQDQKGTRVKGGTPK